MKSAILSYFGHIIWDVSDLDIMRNMREKYNMIIVLNVTYPKVMQSQQTVQTFSDCQTFTVKG